jgi:hypothetical protein
LSSTIPSGGFDTSRRRKHAEQSDRFLREIEPIPVLIEDLMQQAREKSIG